MGRFVALAKWLSWAAGLLGCVVQVTSKSGSIFVKITNNQIKYRFGNVRARNE